MEEEDEFVDAVSEAIGPDSPSPQGSEEEALAEDGDGLRDDDFGDFADQDADDDENDLNDQESDLEYEERRREVREQEIEQSEIESLPPIAFVDYTNKSRHQLSREIFEFLQNRHPAPDLPEPPRSNDPTDVLNNERAMSLWNQLAAPVPLNPPDWKRSRIRRLFLVSLGIPVNLDEILPPSGKKKKLVLPSTKPDTAGPSLSGKLPPQAPPFDAVTARHQASVSGLALKNMTDEELKQHVETLKVVNVQASENLTYWIARRNEAMGEKESLEGVIESLVGYTERQRKGTMGIAMVPGRGKTPPPTQIQSGKKAKKK